MPIVPIVLLSRLYIWRFHVHQVPLPTSKKYERNSDGIREGLEEQFSCLIYRFRGILAQTLNFPFSYPSVYLNLVN